MRTWLVACCTASWMIFCFTGMRILGTGSANVCLNGVQPMVMMSSPTGMMCLAYTQHGDLPLEQLEHASGFYTLLGCSSQMVRSCWLQQGYAESGGYVMRLGSKKPESLFLAGQLIGPHGPTGRAVLPPLWQCPRQFSSVSSKNHIGVVFCSTVTVTNSLVIVKLVNDFWSVKWVPRCIGGAPRIRFLWRVRQILRRGNEVMSRLKDDVEFDMVQQLNPEFVNDLDTVFLVSNLSHRNMVFFFTNKCFL